MKYKHSYLAIIVMLYSGSLLSGQEVSVSARLDTTRAMIGDQLRLHLRVEKPAQTTVNFPVLQDTLTGKIEIIRKSAIDTSRSEPGRIVLIQDLMVTVFDTGFFEIPPLAFAFHSGQLRDTLKSMPVTFEMLSLPLDTTIRDIRANMKAPVNMAEIFPFALGLVALCVVVFLVVFWIRRRMRKGTAVVAEISAESADEIALRELEQLRDEKPWELKQIKPYYIRLTEILRLYIERRYNIMALEQTSEEILAALKKSTNLDSDLKRLASILKLADLVKFAKVIPDQTENAGQLDEAIAFVKSSTLVKDEPKQESDFEHDPVQSNVDY